jgi:hypothetical protein
MFKPFKTLHSFKSVGRFERLELFERFEPSILIDYDFEILPPSPLRTSADADQAIHLGT